MNLRCATLVATFAVAACSSDELPAASGDSGAVDSGHAQLDSSAPAGDATVTDGAADVAAPDGSPESGADAQGEAGDDAALTDGGADDGSFESSSPVDGATDGSAARVFAACKACAGSTGSFCSCDDMCIACSLGQEVCTPSNTPDPMALHIACICLSRNCTDACPVTCP
jgi:hypothetical protein